MPTSICALANMARAGYAPYTICYFKAGDKKIWTEPFPTSLSIRDRPTGVEQVGHATPELLGWRKKQRRKLIKITH